MLLAHTVEQIRAAELVLLSETPDGTLMQQAARGLGVAVSDFLGGTYGRRILLLVGPGDNGGDALFAGAWLARRGARVSAYLVTGSGHEAGLDALRHAGGQVVTEVPGSVDVVVDGILGIGGRPGLPGLPVLPDAPVVAVDLPSGLVADTGAIGGDNLGAALTVTFGTLRVCHLVDPASSRCGTVELVDLGLDLPTASVEALQPADVARLLPRPHGEAQKYSRGVVGLDTGSAAYPGAGVLSTAGANSGLAGMVRYAGGAREAVTAAHPELIPGKGRVQAWVVGCGRGDEAPAAARRRLADGVPTVLDADALTPDVVADLPPSTVLTPHAGELARLLDVDRSQVEAEQLEHARAAAERFGCVVLLKGRHTLVATPGGTVRATLTGTPWLATAGAGDVLAGLIGALLAAGLDAFDAASVGSWLHGSAATLASAGGPLTAGRVAGAIPAAVRALPRLG